VGRQWRFKLFKIVLILSIFLHILAAVLALRLNVRYRWKSAWVLISGATTLMAIQRFAELMVTRNDSLPVAQNIALWTASLMAVTIAILLVGGMALIEPLFLEFVRKEALLSSKNQRLEQAVQDTEEQLQLARDIQRRLLPHKPPGVDGFDIAADSVPAEWTSGDYFDYLQFPDGRLLLVVADVSGHGLGPALLMSDTRASLRAFSLSERDPGRILTQVNQAIYADVEAGRFVTAFLALIDPQTKSMVYCGAGHNAYIFENDGDPQSLNGCGPPLGIVKDFEFETSEEVQLHAGQLVLLATDGVVETENSQSELFGIERIVSTIHQARQQPATSIVATLFNAANDFGDGPQQDDNTAIVMKVS